MNSPRRNLQPLPNSGMGAAVSDCWQEMQSLAQADGAQAWAARASQRPATESRLSHLVGTLERDIIPRLVRAHADAQVPSAAQTPSAQEVSEFTQGILAHDEAIVEALLARLKGRGVSVGVLYTALLAPAARELGRLWEDDRCHFTEVTIGVGRLQQIMRSLSSAFGTEVDPPSGGRRALLMPAPGEQHTFGLSMVAEFFARGGWEVSGLLDPLVTGFEERVAKEWFDLVGISAGSTVRLDSVRDCVAAVRARSHNRRAVVLVGGPLFILHPDLAAQVNADAAVSDGQTAPELAEQLLGQRARKL